MAEESRRSWLWSLLAALGAVLFLALLTVPLFFHPFEDAAILYQYSANLANNGVISFVPHGPPAEGATDFLWMVYLALGRAMNIPSYLLATFTNAYFAVLLAWLLVTLTGKRPTLWNTSAVLCLLFMAPQTFAAAAGFGIFEFSLMLCAMAAAVYRKNYGVAVVAGLMLSLLRADGVLFAFPVLFVYLFQGEDRRQRIWKFAFGFVLPGLVYFLWRWHYFGHLLPLPFYVKSDTPRIVGLFVKNSAVGLSVPLIAASAILLLALRKRILERENLILIGALMLPSSLFYMAMRLDQNYANRFFFYPLLVMAVLIVLNYEQIRVRQQKILLGGLAVWGLTLAYFWVNWAVNFAFDYPQPQIAAVSLELAKLPQRGSMIVTESGAIPFYSEWTAYDPWGLNTPAFAAQLIQPQDVATLRPDLVIVHQDIDPLPCTVQPDANIPYTKRTWEHMTQNVIAGVDPDLYAQWLLPQFNAYYRSHPVRWNGVQRYGKGDYQCWFIRKDYPESGAVMDILKRHGGMTALEFERSASSNEVRP